MKQFRLVLNQSENGIYNPDLVWINQIQDKYVDVYQVEISQCIPRLE